MAEVQLADVVSLALAPQSGVAAELHVQHVGDQVALEAVPLFLDLHM